MCSPPRDVLAGILGDTVEYGLEHRVQGLARRRGDGRKRCTDADGRTVARMENILEPHRCGPRSRRAARTMCTSMWIALMLALSVSCSRSDPEAALRGSVDALSAAIEARDPAAMQQHLAADFIGNDGLDRDGARRLAMGYVLRHRDLGVTVGPMEVEMAAAHATVRCKAILRGGSGRALPDSARIYDVESGWRMEDGEWKLASARWTPVM
ncbi:MULTISPECIES: hypothetical protein [unclassified Luteimonas]